MQRVLPIFILAVFAVALVAAIFPLPRPLGEAGSTLETRLGLDLIGGLRGEYQVVATDDQAVTPEILEQTRTIVENRVNATGVAEPIVVTQGQDRISVELPGVDDEGEIRRLIGTTGVLEFMDVPDALQGAVGEGPLPEGMQDVEPIFTGVEVEAASIGQDQTTGEIVVQVTLKSTGARLFDEYADDNFGRQFAIVLDEEVISAPVLQATRFGGQAQISGGPGGFPIDEANSLVTVLRLGSLPLEIREVGFSSISATLGLDFLNQTILAGAIGIALVFAFMLLYYRVPGLVACIALIFYSVFVYAIFRAFGVTLTLAGIAAFILSVGMAVDANILIFERTKEELRSGKNLSASVEAGFNRAWNSILDSNVSTLITATILFYFGTSVVKGFALVLIIGVLVSMFTAITLSRIMLRWIVQQDWARQMRLFGIQEAELSSDARSRRRDAGREATA
jgi:preprotein translocase subunit SecD